MKKRKLIVHCSDSNVPEHTTEVIRKWHTDPKKYVKGKNVGGRGWSDIGYHWVIEYYGELVAGRPIYKLGAHCKGYNDAIGLCLCGLSGDFRNCQLKTLEAFVIDNAGMISEVEQHSKYDPKKPHCAGLSESQLQYLNSLI